MQLNYQVYNSELPSMDSTPAEKLELINFKVAENHDKIPQNSSQVEESDTQPVADSQSDSSTVLSVNDSNSDFEVAAENNLITTDTTQV